MNYNQKNILLKFLIWSIILFVLIFIGANNIFALETKTLYSTNSSGTLSNSNKYTYGFINQGGVQTTSSASVNTTVNGRALALIYYIYEPVVLNKTYTMEINFMSNDLINTFTSSMVEVATCNDEVCNDNTIVSVTKSSPSGMSNKLTIEFNPITSGSILMVNLSDKTREFYITGLYNQQTFGIKSVTLDSTNQNQDIIDNQTNNTNNIINNNNSNTQEIINNQNQNTQDIVDSQYTCKTRSITLNNYKDITDSYLASNGSLVNSNVSNYYSVTSYIKIQQNQPYIINLRRANINSPAFCLYDNNKELISCTSFSSSTEISFNSGNATYFRSTLRDISTGISEIYLNGNICLKDSQEIANQNEEAEETRKGILGKLGELISNLFSTDDADISGLNNMVGWLPPGPVDSIINLPLNLFNALTNVLSGTCQGVTLNLPFVNQTLTLPCFDAFMSQYLTGFSTFWTWFGVTMSVFILYRYLLTLYAWIDNTLTMRENNLPGYYDENMWGGA